MVDSCSQYQLEKKTITNQRLKLQFADSKAVAVIKKSTLRCNEMWLMNVKKTEKLKNIPFYSFHRQSSEQSKTNQEYVYNFTTSH